MKEMDHGEIIDLWDELNAKLRRVKAVSQLIRAFSDGSFCEDCPHEIGNLILDEIMRCEKLCVEIWSLIAPQRSGMKCEGNLGCGAK
jgi:hypothetical protein